MNKVRSQTNKNTQTLFNLYIRSSSTMEEGSRLAGSSYTNHLTPLNISLLRISASLVQLDDSLQPLYYSSIQAGSSLFQQQMEPSI